MKRNSTSRKAHLLIFLSILSILFSCSSGKTFNFEVPSANNSIRQSLVSVDIPDNFGHVKPILYKKEGRVKKEIACQAGTRADGSSCLYWIHENSTETGTEYILQERSEKPETSPIMKIEDNGRSLVFRHGEKKIINYHYARMPQPDGAEDCFGRSGFIHPVWSPQGSVLTRIQPEDHIEQYGVFMPWAQMEYNGKIYDSWNLGKNQGTVKAGSVLSKEEGPVFSRCSMSLGHYISDKGQEIKIMDEIWTIRAYAMDDYFMWDFESALTPCTTFPVLLKKYNYGGFSWRLTEDWKAEVSQMMTSEGDGIRRASGKKARWIYTEGSARNGIESGFIIMSDPANFNHPETL